MKKHKGILATSQLRNGDAIQTEILQEADMDGFGLWRTVIYSDPPKVGAKYNEEITAIFGHWETVERLSRELNGEGF